MVLSPCIHVVRHVGRCSSRCCYMKARTCTAGSPTFKYTPADEQKMYCSKSGSASRIGAVSVASRPFVSYTTAGHWTVLTLTIHVCIFTISVCLTVNYLTKV